MPTKTLTDHWEEFEAQVINPSASKIQREEMQRAFYSGAMASALVVSHLCQEEIHKYMQETLAALEERGEGMS